MSAAVKTESALVPLARLHESPFNRRRSWGDLDELAASIRQVGLLEDLLVRPHPKKRGEYELVFGHRRLRAAKLAGLDAVPAKVRALDDAAVLEAQCIENLQREDVHPLDEAETYEQLLKVGKVTAEDIAARVGKSRSYVFGRLKLLALCEEARQAFAEEKLSASVALYVARIPSADLQRKALEELDREAWDGQVSAREAKAIIEHGFMLRLADAPFDRAGCSSCPKRTGNQPELFADVSSADVCTDPPCFTAKKEAHFAAKLQEATKRGLPVITGRDAEQEIQRTRYDGRSKYIDLDRETWSDDEDDDVLGDDEEREDERDEPAGRPERVRKTYRELLAGAELQVTVAQDRDGTIHELVAREDVAKLLPAEAAPSGGARSSYSEDEKKRKEASARKRVRTMAVIAAVVDRAEATTEDDGELWPFLAEVLIEHLGHDQFVEIARRRGIEVTKRPSEHYPNYERALRETLKGMDWSAAKGLAIELAISAGGTFSFGSYCSSELGKSLLSAAKYYGVDAAKVGAAALAAAKKAKAAKGKPKAKKGTKPAPAKKSGKRGAS